MTLTPEQEMQVKMLRDTFPYRIIYAAVHPTTGEFVASAVATMRIPKDLARKGWSVVTIK
jgi:hypothetical protein